MVHVQYAYSASIAIVIAWLIAKELEREFYFDIKNVIIITLIQLILNQLTAKSKQLYRTIEVQGEKQY